MPSRRGLSGHGILTSAKWEAQARDSVESAMVFHGEWDMECAYASADLEEADCGIQMDDLPEQLRTFLESIDETSDC
jgi:hypothetical protein